ncbi:MAG: 50S ribosomal protein L24e [Candidatus Lokiarchaeota archaeon]|nr:50S ribosomal protein L24e [Candidatus Lokiarchaeota archaeon]
MVKVKKCDFCGYNIQPGEGTTYIRNDGSILNFCCKKCRLARLKYKKNPRKTRWTKYFQQQ